MDGRSLLLAGGIAEASATVEGVATSPLEARVYEHTALPGRKIVRLSPEAVGAATDVEMSVLGFAQPSSTTKVGQSVLRALGFPAWAVVNDPKHARFALEVMQEFRKAARRIRSKPGFAAEDLANVAKRLERSVPHFLPSFWEEAGRAFIHEGALRFAAQCFEKARAAEAAFKLKVDEDQRSRAYLEFALAGAVATKSLAGYASDLVAAFGPKEGYRRFFDLAVQRTRGGMPPWAGISKDLRRLAKGAGASADEADRSFLEMVIESPSVARAPADFWSSYRPILMAMAKSEPRIRARLRWLFPRLAGVTEWLTLLEESGATDAFVVGHGDASSEAQGATANWASEFVVFARAGTNAPPGPEVFHALEKIAPRLRSEGVPALLATSTRYWQSFDPDILEKALELEIALADPKATERVTMDLGKSLSIDPVRLAVHPVYGPYLTSAVADVCGKADFEARAAGKKGLVEARRQWLDGAIERLTSGALPWLASGTKTVVERVSAAMLEEFPEAAAKLRTTSAAAALQRTLRAGILDEFGWPDFERVAAELTTKASPAELYGTVSRPILRAGSRVVVFDGATVSGEFSLPTSMKHVHGITAVGSAILVKYNDANNDQRAAWSDDWTAPFACDASIDRLAADAALSPNTISLGGRAIQQGDRNIAEQGRLASDGTTYWRVDRSSWDQPIRCTEFDPRTGTKSRASWPTPFRALTENDDGLRMQELMLLPAPKGAEQSPLGVRDGLIGWAARGKAAHGPGRYEITRIDGKRWEGTSLRPFGLMTFPGSDEPRPITVGYAYAPGQEASISVFSGNMMTYDHGGAKHDDVDATMAPIAGFARIVHAVWLHYVRPRDATGSQALREIGVDACSELLAAAAKSETREQARAEVRTTLDRVIPKLKHPLVRDGVERAVLRARRLETELQKLLRDGGSRGGRADVHDNRFGQALPVSLMPQWGHGQVGRTLARSAEFLAGEDVAIPTSGTVWFDVLPNFARALVFLATREARGEDRAIFTALLRTYAETVFATGMRLRRARIEAPSSAKIASGKGHGWWGHVEGKSRFCVRHAERRGDVVVMDVLEAFDGEPLTPSGANIVSTSIIETADEREVLQAMLAELEARGPVPFRAEDADAVTQLSGRTAAEAKLVVLGLPNFNTWAIDFLGKPLREKTDLKSGDAKVARLALKELAAPAMFAILAAGARVDSAGDLWVASSLESPAPWASSLAEALAPNAGTAAAHPPALIDDVKKVLGWRSQPRTLLDPLLDPSATTLDPRPRAPRRIERRIGDSLDRSFLEAAADVWPVLALSRPLDDAYVAGLVRAHARLIESLADERTVIDVGMVYSKEASESVVARLGGTSTMRDAGKDDSYEEIDNGVAIAWKVRGSVELAIRTAALFDKKKAPEVTALTAIVSEQPELGSAALAALAFFVSPGWTRAIKRIETAKAPAGSFDADPRLSAPSIVTKAAKELGLTEAAGMLYLELLALPAPTDRFILEINRWKPTELAGAKKELVAKKLAIEGKRERAGRDIFLPGAWETRGRSFALPVEAWKLPFYGGSAKHAIVEPIGELYARALERALGADRPRFEEVSAVRKPKGKKA